jgi:hypothetical protein
MRYRTFPFLARSLATIAAVVALAGCQESSVHFAFAEHVSVTTDGAAIVRMGVQKAVGLGLYTSGSMGSRTNPCNDAGVRADDPTVVSVVQAGTRTLGGERLGLWNVTGLRKGRTTLIATCGDHDESQLEIEVRALSDCEDAASASTLADAGAVSP